MAINQAELFQNVPDEKIHLNKYDLSFDNTFTTEIGRLAVAFCRRVLPGETWSAYYDMFVRTLPLIAPVYGKMDIFAHAFYCTNRSLSNVWEQYIKAGDDGETEYLPDLLSVRNIDYDIRDSLSPFVIGRVAGILAGSEGTSDNLLSIVDEFEKDNSYRPPFTHGSLFDYLNVNSSYHVTDVIESINDSEIYPDGTYMRPFKYSLLPFKAYQSIWSEYYADANVMAFDGIANKNGDDMIDWRWMQQINQIEVVAEDVSSKISSVSPLGDDITNNHDNMSVLKNLFKTRNRCFAKDYFTSSLPEPQRGPDVLIPIDAEIDILNDRTSTTPSMFGVNYLENSDPIVTGFFGFDDNQSNGYRTMRAGSARTADPTQPEVTFEGGRGLRVYNANQLRAEISSLSATITDLRTAVALQQFYESSARYGNRYKEFVYGHFASMIPDDQLTRPWYLGGVKIPVMISDVMQTAPDSNSNLGVGEMFGKGVSATNNNNFLFKRKFDDYGLIMVIVSIRPHNYYKNTLLKEWTITDRMEEYWRKLQAVGEENIYNWELVGLSSDSSEIVKHSDDIFGYQMRYSNYKFSNDEVHGDFKGNLAYWTMCRDFSSGVTLSPEFLEVHPREFNHIFQYSGLDSDHFLINSHFSITRETPMDIYSIPRIS